MIVAVVYGAMATALDVLRRKLADSPVATDGDLAHGASVEPAIAASVHYLASDAAQASLAADIYWPKWHSPWWHMLLLHELGEARRIPERAVAGMVEGLQAFPLKIFPIEPGELPPGADPHRHVLCHCALGSIVQVLSACGRDVDRDLPWARPWFVRYQMADGGLNCDDTAYLERAECPSSMVGTIAAFEAMLLGDPRDWTADQAAFVERAAGFLIERRLMLGSQTRHNAGERDRQPAWLAPCFPRFYLYDVIRGLGAVVRWSEHTDRSLPLRAISGVIDHVLAAFPDGAIRLQRQAYGGVGTWVRSASGDWVRGPVASRFPLLEATSAIGLASPAVTRQWSAARHAIVRLLDRGQITND
jgi:hypothetical protein